MTKADKVFIMLFFGITMVLTTVLATGIVDAINRQCAMTAGGDREGM